MPDNYICYTSEFFIGLFAKNVQTKQLNPANIGLWFGR